ncbi:MAG: phospholipase D-like domain-containing protein, partial [Spirochaetes bacterium]|nr:phospholipase D-like domain-containing protein [Spirochaetota bacterium]
MNSSPGITFFFSKWRFFFIISVISAIFFSACSSTPVISAGKPSQIAAVAAISVLPVVYIAAGILPYAGDPIVSDELRNSFNMDNFFGESPIPERVKLLDCGWEAFTHRVNLISKAQQEIYFATFIFRRGTTPAIIIGALLSAADRGVRVNVIIDGKGNLMPRRYMDILA